MHSRRRIVARLALALLATSLLGGCTPLGEYVQNGFKVGPNYGKPPAPVAPQWIDADDVRLRRGGDDTHAWWSHFNDPILEALVCDAYRQNLTLREAGFRVLQARAQRAITVGSLLPQTQDVTASYTRQGISTAGFGAGGFGVGGAGVGVGAGVGGVGAGGDGFSRFFDLYSLNFRMAWELDFWGRFRRAVEAADGDLNASVEAYDDVLVTLIGDVATNYIQVRTFQQQIDLLRANITIQQETLRIATAKLRAGRATELDVAQSRSTLAQTESQIPQTEIQLRQATNRLCVLLGTPPEELTARLGKGPIPGAPPEVVVGIPADLLRRRPDVRRAERLAAAESARIGVAQSQLYPHVSINGSFGWQARSVRDLFTPEAFQGSIGPSFRWDILNYGRLLNAVSQQDARFQEAVAGYQNSVLTAAEEVENGLVAYLKNRERVKSLTEAVTEAEKAVKIAVRQFEAGAIDFNRVAVLQQDLVLRQDALARSQGDVSLGLVQVYRALGGGWQVRVVGCDVPPTALPKLAPPPDALPAPGLAPPAGPRADGGAFSEAAPPPRVALGVPN